VSSILFVRVRVCVWEARAVRKYVVFYFFRSQSRTTQNTTQMTHRQT